ncbi:INO80 complex subunit C [Wickerhamomyces ciferrii]|uniref:INO80 complex subunit C n=1 Tax=Wickerhamomyces ciferrii (strain ATCC 14091 / BCRC 22168 / CBS 111 / JCM 3599 / NBRC 0793 / NRRL Y-1031 F-60-10) TaxID=1206466 RepID=K0KKF2_WICCF|nr:INO80 complex subunit C [Wickerhamomyces ciferrii]CCH42637.1 INO80 complex subunit C [Wickerhamomyces ciferrii]
MTEVDIYEVAQSNSGPFSFKNPNHKHPTRRVKATKQLIIDEQKYLKLNEDKLKSNSINYFTIESPPSLKPSKKYCDITGLKGNYKSPSSGIRYYNGEIYSIVKNMASGVDQQYLELRNANVVLK